MIPSLGRKIEFNTSRLAAITRINIATLKLMSPTYSSSKLIAAFTIRSNRQSLTIDIEN